MVSLHPACDDRSLTFDDGLVGTWKSDDDDTTVEFASAEWRSYRLTMRTPRSTTTLTAHLTRVVTIDLLDVMPTAGVDLATFAIPVHGLYSISRDGDTLTVAAIDYDAALRALPKGIGIAAALDERKNVVLTAGTVTLRQWITRRGAGAPVFTAGSTLKRVQAD